ncbi:MAG: putative protein YisK [Phycisphaerae bacterium]|nr:putative protein YisK [Phycisphaerae bacterium]
MRLVTFIRESGGESLGGRPRVGAMIDDGAAVVDLQAAAVAAGGCERADFADMLVLLEAGPAAMDAARAAVEFATAQRPGGAVLSAGAVALLSPLPRPRSIRDCMVYERHVIDATQGLLRLRSRPVAVINGLWLRLFRRPLVGPPRAWRDRPIYYKGNPQAVVGTGATIRWPSFSGRLDFELEVGAFIGQAGRDIPAAEAMGHVAGFAIFNDFTARDAQWDEMAGRLGPAASKDFDTANAIGPALVTPDEVGDPHALATAVRVNGRLWSRGTTAGMRFDWPRIIAHLSRDQTLAASDFIAAGTVAGGCGLELNRWLSPGDVIELEVERLGVLRNTIGPRTVGQGA